MGFLVKNDLHVINELELNDRQLCTTDTHTQVIIKLTFLIITLCL